jgi:hypothetical protein
VCAEKSAHWKLCEINTRHWDAVARTAGLLDAQEILSEIAEQTLRAINTVSGQIPKKFPQEVLDKILEGLCRTI